MTVPVDIKKVNSKLKMKNWEYQMHSAVRVSFIENKVDILNLYLNLEKMAKPFLENNEMEEGSSFRVPLSDGSDFIATFYKNYTLADVIYSDGSKQSLVSKKDAYMEDYSKMDLVSSMLRQSDLGIGLQVPEEFRNFLKECKSGDVVHFDSNLAYVCEYTIGSGDNLTLSFRRISNNKSPSLNEIDSYESVPVVYKSNISVQNFYDKIKDAYTDDMKYGLSTINDARALLNKLVSNIDVAKEISIGSNRFLVKKSTSDKNLVYYDSKGNLLPENKILYYLGWLKSSPNNVKIKRLEKPTAKMDFEDRQIKREFEDLMYNSKDYQTALNKLFAYCEANDGLLKIDMSSYVQNEVDFEAVTFTIKSENGNLSIKKLYYEDNDFNKNVVKIVNSSETELLQYCKQKYNENFKLIKSKFAEQVKKDHPEWNNFNLLDDYFNKKAIKEIENSNIGEINLDNDVSDVYAFMDSNIGGEGYETQ